VRIVERRFLRGPNVHAAGPCLLATVDLAGERDRAPRDIDGLVERLLFDGSDERLAARLASAPGLGQAAALLAATLQAAAGDGGGRVRVRGVRGRPELRRLVLPYGVESVVEGAVDAAVEAVDAALAGRTGPDLASAARGLAELCRRDAPAPAVQQAIAVALRRGIPVVPRDDGTMQLGWGVKQRELPPPDTWRGGSPADAVAALFDPASDDDGRIPTVAVTGSNGKTTTSLLLAHVLRSTGRRTGATSTEGIFIDGRPIERGDCAGPASARTLFRSPVVEVAVLETARGGILKRGLAYDRSDVGVVLNVAADHLGLEGVETLGQLAWVKGLVARTAHRAAVLNAEDSHCVRMARRLRPGCETVWFALGPEAPPLAAHRAAGGRSVVLDEDQIVVWEGAVRRPLLEVERLRIAMQGAARHNIANACAAAAAALALGIDAAAIETGLATFDADVGGAPLRGNRFDWDGVTLLVDYAHNAAAYQALGAMGRALAGRRGGRLLGVVTSPGDRRAADLHETGAVCGRAFDALVVYEVHPRGRAAGQTTAAIVEGAQAVAPDRKVEGVPDIRAALARGHALARPGDVLVFTCADLGLVAEAVGAIAPDVAARIDAGRRRADPASARAA
jgi:cyanophycin synthetase